MFRALVLSLATPGRRWCTLAALLGLGVMISLPPHTSLPTFCGALSRVPLQDWVIVLGSPSALELGISWVLMVIAMMAPLFAEPMRHVWFASLPARRGWAIFLCAVSYILVWLSVAPVIIIVTWVLSAYFSTNLALPLSIGAAITWSASPVAQCARNRCHRFMRIGASGRRADRECLIQGLHSGAMCVVTCWPWMVAPMLLSGLGHVAAMMAVSLWLALERIHQPREPRWQWPPTVSQLLWQWRLRPRDSTIRTFEAS